VVSAIRVLPPGNNQILTNLQFTVAQEGDEEVITRIDLVNDRELSPILNIFTVNSQSRLPVLDGASVTVYPEGHHERLSVRGYVNFTGNVDITDAIYLLAPRSEELRHIGETVVAGRVDHLRHKRRQHGVRVFPADCVEHVEGLLCVDHRMAVSQEVVRDGGQDGVSNLRWYDPGCNQTAQQRFGG
jgi:hypothetical protein